MVCTVLNEWGPDLFPEPELTMYYWGCQEGFAVGYLTSFGFFENPSPDVYLSSGCNYDVAQYSKHLLHIYDKL